MLVLLVIRCSSFGVGCFFCLIVVGCWLLCVVASVLVVGALCVVGCLCFGSRLFVLCRMLCARCLLFVVCCSLRVARSSLLVADRVLYAVCWLVFVDHLLCVLYVCCCLLFVAWCLLLSVVVCCSLFVVRCLLLFAGCRLFVA